MRLPTAIVLLLSFSSLSAQQPARSDDPYFRPTRPLEALSPQGGELIRLFNTSSARPRLLLLLSPTCTSCRQAAAQVQRILETDADLRLRLLAVWTPQLAADSRNAALRATSLLGDRRTAHLFDSWGFAAKVFAARLKPPSGKEAWGILLGFPAGGSWGDLPPTPTLRLSLRQSSIGEPFSQERLLQWLRSSKGD